MEIVLCGDERSLRRACLGQHVKSFNIINQNLVAVNKKPKSIKLRKPLAVGFSILELSKLFMYKSYYDVFQKHFGKKIFLYVFLTQIRFCFKLRTKIWNQKKQN